MPRTLPWLCAENNISVKKESTPRKRVKPEPSPDRDLTPKNPPVSPTRRDFFRSSQSPPTSPIKSCPVEEFLIEGIEHDDGWVMVEDEFYAVAQTFTRHLHHAEYIRRRNAVKAANAARIGEIERPTDGHTALPTGVERKREAEALRERPKAVLTHIEDGRVDEQDEAEEDERWAGTHLHDLMISPRKTRLLADVHAPKSSTRAAAGFGQAPTPGIGRAQVNSIGSVTTESSAVGAQSIDLDEETASGSDDDLDQEPLPFVLPLPKRKKTTPRKSQIDDQTTPRGYQQLKTENTSTSIRTQRPTKGRPSPMSGFKSKVQSLFDDLDELPESSRVNKSIFTNTREPCARQNPATDGEDNLDPKSSRHNEVPTFLV